MRTRSIAIFFITAFNLFVGDVLAAGVPTDKLLFQMKWTQEKVSFDVKTFELSLSDAKRAGETGDWPPKNAFTSPKELPEGKIEIFPGEKKYILLQIKNKNAKESQFSVAPHMTHPMHATLGFNFRCLCNGHKYKVGASGEWYRVMVLKTEKTALTTENPIELTHLIFSVDQ